MYLVFKHSKRAFYFWAKPFGACKKRKKQDQMKEGWYCFSEGKDSFTIVIYETRQ
jgi:hypothetical protein